MHCCGQASGGCSRELAATYDVQRAGHEAVHQQARTPAYVEPPTRSIDLLHACESFGSVVAGNELGQHRLGSCSPALVIQLLDRPASNLACQAVSQACKAAAPGTAAPDMTHASPAG